MAFPIPEHLPRKSAAPNANPQDISTAIITKIGDTSAKGLNAAVASSWVHELDETIRQTRLRIHERIHSELPEFERQLETSKNVQTRLQSLTRNAAELQHGIEDDETGLIPTFVQALEGHSGLAQRYSNAHVLADGVFHLRECVNEYQRLVLLTKDAKLDLAIQVARSLETKLQRVPAFLNDANVMKDLMRKFQASRASVEEQLNQAYLRSVSITPSTLAIHSSVPIPPSSSTLRTVDIITSLGTTALAEHLKTLRRDIVSYYMDAVLQGKVVIEVDNENGAVMATSADPDTVEPRSRLHSLTFIVHFVAEKVLPLFPSSQSVSLAASLCRPISDGVLKHLLVANLPGSFGDLPAFLDLVGEASNFEIECLVGVLKNDWHDTPVKDWADHVGGHYARKRRVDILNQARSLVLDEEWEESGKTFMAEWEPPGMGELQMDVVAVQDGENTPSAAADDAWGFQEGDADNEDDADGWGFDDKASPVSPSAPEPNEAELEPDPEDAWGWEDDTNVDVDASTNVPSDDSAWDDPWGDEPPVAPLKPTKVASKLEKLANKGKKSQSQTNKRRSPSPSPPPRAPHSLPPPNQKLPQPPTETKANKPAPLQTAPPLKETYLVSARIPEVLRMVERVLSEADEFISSDLFPSSASASSGGILRQCASSILDLYRALYPAVFASRMNAMRYANDCWYLYDELHRVQKTSNTAGQALEDGKTKFKVLSESWADDAIDGQRRSIQRILETGAQGFTFTHEQDRYDACESAINEVLQNVRSLARQWKPILAKSKYYAALGAIVNAALGRMLDDILGLPDITEVESKRLAELCRIVNALEGMFVEDPMQQQVSLVVAYVPLWLKFSYLSELLEASLVDIAYLFESEALVDFETEELVTLVQALFSDTPLRANLIQKIQAGQSP